MTRFIGDLTLREMLGADGKPIPTKDGRAQWYGAPPPLVYVDRNGFFITFPVGEPTDLGSIPQDAWSLGFSPDGEGAEAYAIHDLLYRTSGTCLHNGKVYRTRPAPYTRAEADWILRDGLGLCGMSVVRRNLIYAAVRWGGADVWGH